MLGPCQESLAEPGPGRRDLQLEVQVRQTLSTKAWTIWKYADPRQNGRVQNDFGSGFAGFETGPDSPGSKPAGSGPDRRHHDHYRSRSQ